MIRGNYNTAQQVPPFSSFTNQRNLEVSNTSSRASGSEQDAYRQQLSSDALVKDNLNLNTLSHDRELVLESKFDSASTGLLFTEHARTEISEHSKNKAGRLERDVEPYIAPEYMKKKSEIAKKIILQCCSKLTNT